VISYDTNVVTGGLGARYFGIGASTNYRQDRITVYLRAVSTQTGEILKTVYTSKTILSTAISGSFFRYVDTEKLMEAEVGITQNEPVHLAVTEAIEKAVYGLIVEGVKDNIWGSKVENPTQFTKIIEDYNAEKSDNDLNVLGKKIADNQRAKFSMYGMAEATQIRGDYVNPKMHPGAKGGMKYFFSDHFNIDGNASYFIFENKKLFWRRAISADVNIEYLLLPKSKFTPYVYGGVGSVFYRDKNFFKSQVGGGLEYLVNRTFALRLNTQYDLGFNDDWDFKVQGTRKDQSVRIGLGINVYLNRKTAQPLKTTNP
jgi:curli production assembly/transport component CsgG